MGELFVKSVILEEIKSEHVFVIGRKLSPYKLVYKGWVRLNSKS